MLRSGWTLPTISTALFSVRWESCFTELALVKLIFVSFLFTKGVLTEEMGCGYAGEVNVDGAAGFDGGGFAA